MTDAGRSSPRVGGAVTMGAFQWRVLAVDGGRALAITGDVFEMGLPYHDERKAVA